MTAAAAAAAARTRLRTVCRLRRMGFSIVADAIQSAAASGAASAIQTRDGAIVVSGERPPENYLRYFSVYQQSWLYCWFTPEMSVSRSMTPSGALMFQAFGPDDGPQSQAASYGGLPSSEE